MASGDEIYSNLNSKKLSDVSATDIDTVTEPLHIQRTNEGALRTTVLVNAASMRDGGVIPGTMILDLVTEESNGYYDVFTASEGECWMVCTLNWETKNGDSISFYLNDGTNRARIAYFGATAPDLGAEMPPNLYVTTPCKVEVLLAGSTGSNTATCTRVRVR